MKNLTEITHPSLLTDKENVALKKRLEELSAPVTEAHQLLLRYRDGEGWRLDGFASFSDAWPKQFPWLLGSSTSQVYRILDKAQVEQNIGTSVPLKVAEVIAKLPAAEQAPALEEATLDSGGKKPTVAAAKKAAEKRQATTPEPAPKKPSTNEKLEVALVRLKELVGKKVADAIRNQELTNVKPKSAIFWASLKDADAISLNELVVTKRWTPEKAHKFLSKAPGEKSTIADLQLLAISSDGATLVTTGSFCTVVYNWKSRVSAHSEIKKLLGL